MFLISPSNIAKRDNWTLLTPYIVDQKSMLKPIVQAALLCCTMIVKKPDCAAPTKLIHVVNDNWAGYLFNV